MTPPGASTARQLGATAFDFFGILLPGSILFVAFAMALAMASGKPVNTDLGSIDGFGWAVTVFASYLAGHIAQIAGRYVDRAVSLFRPWGRVFRVSVDSADDQITEELLECARKSLGERLGVALGGIRDVEISNLTDEFMDTYGSGDRIENYRSREVYFRGVTTALIGIALVMLVRSGVSSPLTDLDAAFPGYAFLAIGAACLFGAWSTGNAYRRLRRRRMRHSILGYLTLEGGGTLPPAPSKPVRATQSRKA